MKAIRNSLCDFFACVDAHAAFNFNACNCLRAPHAISPTRSECLFGLITVKKAAVPLEKRLYRVHAHRAIKIKMGNGVPGFYYAIKAIVSGFW